MTLDIDYEIYRYINEQIETYLSFEELLNRKQLSYEEAEKQSLQFQEQYKSLLSAHQISAVTPAAISCGLIQKLTESPENEELQYLYICTVTDVGILNPITAPEQTAEQRIRNYLEQKDRITEFTDFMQNYISYRKNIKH